MVTQPGDDETKAWGTFDIENRVIEIKRDMGAAFAVQILLHECIHIALWDSGAQLTKDQEEQVCTCVASFLMQSGLLG
jgi:hypothetical protein